MEAKTLKDLREAAQRATAELAAEEERQRTAYNDALCELAERVAERLRGARWVVTERSRKNVEMVAARPGWASKETLRVEFSHAEGGVPDLFDDPVATSVEVADVAARNSVRFNHVPHPKLLMAVVDSMMELASPPDQ